ncbi:MAG: ATP-binding cassette domain-containing protein [Alphaproteobacteria bacterium]|nr:ATP-binding cassette domain-containing protein [Alphaproteobacteria bacterium]
MSEPAILQLDAVVRTYVQADARLEVIRGATLKVEAGDLVGLVGPSGAGKSTLLHVAGLLEMPDGGEVSIAGQPCGAMSDGARTEIRRNEIGFVYQFHHLLPEFSAVENVMLPQMIAGRSRRAARKRADELINSVGLRDRASHRPARLSGGEQQRVAIARALANGPRLLLADEPTGNLDSHTAGDVFGLLLDFVRQSGLAAVIATHNLDLAARMDRVVKLEDGFLVDQ